MSLTPSVPTQTVLPLAATYCFPLSNETLLFPIDLHLKVDGESWALTVATHRASSAANTPKASAILPSTPEPADVRHFVLAVPVVKPELWAALKAAHVASVVPFHFFAF